MKNQNEEQIPRSVIKGPGIIAADWGELNGEGQIIYASPNCFVLGLKGTPYMLFITPEFSQTSLIDKFGESIYSVTRCVLQPTFFVNREITYCQVPKWLSNFNKIKYLRLENVNIDDLKVLTNLPIEHLVLENIEQTDSEKVMEAISDLKKLKEISYDQSLPLKLIDFIQSSHIQLSPIIR